MVFGSGAQQRRSANVDVLDSGLQVAAGLGYGLLEGIEVDHYQIDGLNAVLEHDLIIDAAATQDAAMDKGMQGLDPARHHFRKAGVVRDLSDRDPLGRQKAGGTTGGQDLNSTVRKGTGEIDQAGLVGNADEGAANRLHLGPLQ